MLLSQNQGKVDFRVFSDAECFTSSTGSARPLGVDPELHPVLEQALV